MKGVVERETDEEEEVSGGSEVVVEEERFCEGGSNRRG